MAGHGAAVRAETFEEAATLRGGGPIRRSAGAGRRRLFEGEQLGRWVLAQRAGAPGLEMEQQELLAAIGIEAEPELVTAKATADAKPRISSGDRFVLGIAALAAFVKRAGREKKVGRGRKEPVERVEAGPGGEERAVTSLFALGPGLNNTKNRKSGLTPGQLAQLAEHGVEWA
ncbi:hypothetical protein ACIRPK_35045 [Kitasatospora sp. NPDC101801]|uniref:hypothetical protein n=1 Tax=Kitasatospora sp. NPDC101801 TaxID=3364103 RepID=UPI00382BCAEF